ncbi:MAG: PHP domain-containing protein [Bacteriovoracia bacterium]
MIHCDLHTHSLASSCGNHTILELLQFARAKHLKALAITDHGEFLGTKLNSTFFERFRNPYSDIVLYKGIEANPDPQTATLDIPKSYLPFLDFVAVGFHNNIPDDKGIDYNTSLLIEVLQKNPCVDMITHPGTPDFPLNLNRLLPYLRKYGTLLEINNSKILHNRVGEDYMKELLGFCQKNKLPVALNSDAHVVTELGDVSATLPLLRRYVFSRDLIINMDFKKTQAFINERKSRKKVIS